MTSTTGPDPGTLLFAGAGLGTSQSTLEDGLGGLPKSTEHLAEGSPPSFGVWEEEKGERYWLESQRQ